MGLVTGTQYAQPSDLANLGLVGAALANVTGTTQTAALVAASAVVDSYLESAYDLPLANYGSDLVRVTSVIAAYDIMTSRGYNPMAGADQNIRQRYLDAIAWLQQVKDGAQTPAYIIDASGNSGPVPDDGDDSVDTVAGGFGLTSSPVRGWTDRGTPSGYSDSLNDWWYPWTY